MRLRNSIITTFGFGILVMVMLVLAMTGSNANAGEVTFAPDTTFASRYIWRGIPINEEPVLQPSLTISSNGLSINVWANTDLTDWGETKGGYDDETGNFTEIDYTGSYEHSFGPIILSGGFINYVFPNTGSDVDPQWDSTTELFAGIGVDVLLSPSATVYVDEDTGGGATYLSFDVEHSFELWKSGDNFAIGLDLGAHLGLADKNFVEAYYGLDEDFDFHDYSASLSVPFSLPKNFSITPGFTYTSLINKFVRGDVDDNWGLDTQAGVGTLTIAYEFTAKKD